MQNSIGSGVDFVAQMEHAVKQEQIMAAWQSALAAIAPSMAQDVVLGGCGYGWVLVLV
jgi:hypothetical protein